MLKIYIYIYNLLYTNENLISFIQKEFSGDSVDIRQSFCDMAFRLILLYILNKYKKKRNRRRNNFIIFYFF